MHWPLANVYAVKTFISLWLFFNASPISYPDACAAEAQPILHLPGTSGRWAPVRCWKHHLLWWNTHLSRKWCCRNSSREKVNSFFMASQLLWLYRWLANICLYWMPPLGRHMINVHTSVHSFCLCSSFRFPFRDAERQWNLFISQYTANNLWPLDDRDVWNYFWKAPSS